MNASILCIACAFPYGDLGSQCVLVVQPAMQALAMHNAHVRLRHVQPTAVFGRVMKLDLVQDASSLLGRKGVLQARAIVGVQRVLDQTNFLRLWIIVFHQCSHTPGVILAGAPRRDMHEPPASQGLTHHNLMAHAFPFIFVVHPSWLAWPRPLGWPHLTTQLCAGFIETDHGITRVIGQLLGLNDIFHAPDEVGISMGRDTPCFNDPRANVIFFHACRPVSMLIVSTSPRTTSASASSCKVQWHRPWGGSLHAKRTKGCSISPLILIWSGRGGWGWGLRAVSIPSVTNRLRIRSTLRRLVPKARTIWSSLYANAWDVSASKSIRAWVSLRAAALPTETSFAKAFCSSAVKVTRYFSIAGFLSLGRSALLRPHETESRITRQSKIDTALVSHFRFSILPSRTKESLP